MFDYLQKYNSLPKELKDKVTLAAASSIDRLIQHYGEFYDLSLPLKGADGKQVGSIRIGIKASSVNSQVYKLISWALGASVLIFLLAAVLVYFSVSRFITTPITRMERAAEQIASGNLTVKVDVKGKDEIASLGRAINMMASNLSEMITKVRSITGVVSDVTANIAVSSGKVLSGAEMQHDTIKETSNFINEIDNSISNVAKGTERLTASSEETS